MYLGGRSFAPALLFGNIEQVFDNHLVWHLIGGDDVGIGELRSPMAKPGAPFSPREGKRAGGKGEGIFRDNITATEEQGVAWALGGVGACPHETPRGAGGARINPQERSA